MTKNRLWLLNPVTRENRVAPVGYSWAFLIFSEFSLAARSDNLFFFYIFVLHTIWINVLAVLYIAASAPINPVLFLLFVHVIFVSIFASKINQMYLGKLKKKGYRVYRAKRGPLEQAISETGVDIPILRYEDMVGEISSGQVVSGHVSRDIIAYPDGNFVVLGRGYKSREAAEAALDWFDGR